MKIKDGDFGGEYKQNIKIIYEQLMLIINNSEINSPEWNYSWDVLRSHIDHFKYRQMELVANIPQKPLEHAPLQCCQN